MTEGVPAVETACVPSSTDVLAAARIALAEALLFAFALVAGLPWGLWLLSHVTLIAWFGYTFMQSRTDAHDVSPRALTILTALVGGPVGAAAVTAALMLWRHQRTRPEQLAAWYERIALAGDIDDVTRLADTVAMGRAIGTTEIPPRPFAEVMQSGTLADRQTALGLIARRFSPAYAPALHAALVTGEPMVRVQAAAVATRVRAELKSEIRVALEVARASEPADGQQMMRSVGRLRELMSTGMIEDDDRAAAEAEIQRLTGAAASAPARLDAPARALLETELLKQGQFAQFRALRAKSHSQADSGPGAGHG